MNKRIIAGFAASGLVVFTLNLACSAHASGGALGPSASLQLSTLSEAVMSPTSSTEGVAVSGAQTALGLSSDAAVSLIRDQEAFGLVVNELRGKYASAVSGFRWNLDAGRGEITIVGSASVDLKAAVENLARSVNATVIDGGTLSRQARADQGVELSAAIRKAHPDIVNMSVGPSKDYQSLEVVAPIEVSDSVRAWSATQRTPVDVAVTVNPDLSSSLSGGVVGGAQLNSTDGLSTCTSGFSITISGVHYLLTAGHCVNLLEYGFNPWLAYVAERQGNYGDMQYHYVYNGGVAQPKFQYTVGALTTNKYPSWPFIGQLVNRYGRNSQESILIEDDDSTETINGYTYTHMAVTNGGTNNIPGDSRGPFWVGASGGASAVGTLTGSVWINPLYKHAVFTPAPNVSLIWPGASYYTA